ncbi:hypothetical protein CEUSTIGMA_g225.t1 [Chlamydomonas eustigma]|uniref:Glycosyltransferase-like protein LARGE2 n=1 Tax=Chlamydomonas eustigma TaxID=1157962 RepID=A0A250WPZ6_9CHLO|nr:hypothetical protein CEUSTIGMA_g225.t1 [Chlamydomonas eustigma]|eukprot:GAX72769.1 hypothetical protein CEUSTIGMA_g225.t1 [Chlamydomonas eustigma]
MGTLSHDRLQIFRNRFAGSFMRLRRCKVMHCTCVVLIILFGVRLDEECGLLSTFAGAFGFGRSSKLSTEPPNVKLVTALSPKLIKADIMHPKFDADRPKEVGTVAAILRKSKLRVVSLPRGSKAWCPSLRLNNTGYPREPNPLSLAQTVNSKYAMKNMTWNVAMSDDLAAIAIEGIWWSGKHRPVPLTIITQASADRIPQLYSQCKSWRGPLSAVLYISLFQDSIERGMLTPANQETLRQASIAVTDLFADVEKDEAACKLDVILAYEVYTEQRAMMLYPINALRNLARVQARTPLLALMDVDMLMSSKLYRDLVSNSSFAQKLQSGAARRVAFVLPAFETYGETYEAAAIADLLSSKDKSLLVESIRKHIAGPFDFKRFPQGHNCTRFNQWFISSQSYKIKYGARYEPWTIVDRMVAPWHDARFRGYGQNKIVHIAHMNATGFQFVVLSNAFIVHRAHQHTTVRLQLVESKTAYDMAVAAKQPVDKQNVYGHTKNLFDNAQRWMSLGVYKPVLDIATRHCQQKLSWWRLSS